MNSVLKNCDFKSQSQLPFIIMIIYLFFSMAETGFHKMSSKLLKCLLCMWIGQSLSPSVFLLDRESQRKTLRHLLSVMTYQHLQHVSGVRIDLNDLLIQSRDLKKPAGRHFINAVRPFTKIHQQLIWRK